MEPSPAWQNTVPDHTLHAAPAPLTTVPKKACLPLSAGAVVTVLVLSEFAGARNFFVSPRAVQRLALPCALLSLLLCIFLAVKQRRTGVPVAGGQVLNGILLVLLFPMSGLFLVEALPRLANAVVGTSFTSTFTIAHKTHEASSRYRLECFRLELSELQTGWVGKLCASSDEYDSAKPGDKVVMYGNSSWFGLSAKRIELSAGK